jgi:predicted HTH transcriptional regulator
MGMANLRDGGVMIIGVSESEGKWTLDGISGADLGTYDEDEINDFVNRYSSPSIRLELVTVAHRNTRFLALKVPEFDRTPIVCKRNGPEDSGLREGTVYVRPLGKPQTTQAARAEDLEDLLQLAAEKRSREFLATARRIGMRPPRPDEEAFDEELTGL